ncbi:MAG TPA: Hsp20/alpha crystallin family protein [Microthrixaceae bacterium]|nr:Hsp20/alpha crystallin family protein [Microthrixaceae bacterium]
MAITHHERTPPGNDWPFRDFPRILGSQFEDWPALNGLGYPDLNVLDDVADVERMRLEEYRENGSLVIKAEIPGVDPDRDIDITLSDGSLDIHYERCEQHESTDENGYYRSEFSYGEFTRRVSLPGGVASQDVTASYKDGILEIRVPVRSEVASDRIPITRG